MNQSTVEKVRYRIGRAHQSIEEAALLAGERYWTAAANRLYYACFYAASSLIAVEGLESSKHSGVQSFFNLHFVKPGIFSSDVAKIYNRLFSYRSRVDYRDFEDADEVSVLAFAPRVSEFVDQAVSILETRYDIEFDSE